MNSSSLCQLLKNHIDNLWSKHILSYKDIAKALNLNINSVRTGVYNDRLGLEKLCKIAIVAGFPLMRYAGELVTRYPKEIRDLEDAQNRIRTYNAALQSKILVTYEDNEAYKEAFDLALRESTEDTATVVMLAKMRRSVGEQDIEDGNTLKELTRMQGQFDEHSQEHKEIYDKMQRVQEDYNKNKIGKVPTKIPVPEELGELVEKVTSNEVANKIEDLVVVDVEENVAVVEDNIAEAKEEETNMAEVKTVEEKIEEVKTVKTERPNIKEMVRPFISNMKGMEALAFYETFKALCSYGMSGNINDLTECINSAADLLGEADITPEALG